jgi:nucleotide-binding universal stress UspA family protein
VKILLAYDGSDDARHALEHAASLAAQDGGTVRVVSVVGLHAAAGFAAGEMRAAESRERAEEVQEARRLLEARGIRVETVEPTGDPGSAIVDQAEAYGADLIVMGTRGRSTLGRMLLGSVSTRVLHNAPCDVLVVRGDPS